ncbi:MAG TPA: hypothetical protein DER56_03435 [Thermosipho africanus]|jgi:uncharacterized protein (TIGR04255 family)|nr:hypothetical protein [Thermosipho africanus]
MIMDSWPNLNNPPVVAAIFQLKYVAKELSINSFLTLDSQIKNNLPHRSDNIHVGIDLGNSSIPLGVSSIHAKSDAKINSYVYSSEDKKTKLEITENSVTFIDESPYIGWSHFKESATKFFNILSEILNKTKIVRTSIRFINRFSFEKFDSPEEYFNTLISSTNDGELPYPVQQYGFKIIMVVPNSNIHSIVNQNVEVVPPSPFNYTFDIDVLDKDEYPFNIVIITEKSESLREIKNKIFFENITQKTIDLCN